MNGNIENLLLCLASYTPRPDRNPLEDYCTEILAWCLRNSISFRQSFLKALEIDSEVESADGPKIDTQYSLTALRSVHETPGRRRFDLVISDPGGDWLLIIEVKVNAEFSCGQLDAYQQLLAHPKFARFRKRLLATLTRSERPPSEHRHVPWSRVYEILHESMNEEATTRSDFVSEVCRQFMTLLQIHNMAPIKIESHSAEQVRQWTNGLRFREAVEKILESVRQDAELKPLLKSSPTAEFPADGSAWIGIYGKSESSPGTISYIGFKLCASGSLILGVEGAPRISVELLANQFDTIGGKAPFDTWEEPPGIHNISIKVPAEGQFKGNAQVMRDWFVATAKAFLCPAVPDARAA